MGAAILILLVIPFTNTSFVRNTTYRPIFKFFFWLFIADYILLAWIGQMPVRPVYIFVGQVLTVFYFVFFIIIVPMVGTIETTLIDRQWQVKE